MPQLKLGATLPRIAPRDMRGFIQFVWASEWTSSVGTNEGSGTGQQYRGLRVDGSGRIWASGGLITYNGAATAEEYISTDALTTPGGDGPTGQKVNYIAVAHRASDGVHQVATAIGNTNNYARCYAVTHDTVNGLTYIAGRAGEHMETTAGAYQTTFQGDGNPNTLYGPQDPHIAAIDTATGELVYASYFGVSTSGDFFRDIIYHNGYIYAGQARYAPSGTTRGVRLLKIEPDLSDIVAVWDFENQGNSDGQPALVARGDDLWCYLITTVEIANGAPATGAFQETFGSDTHSRSYLAKFDISGTNLSFVQATYIRTLTGTSPLVGATHAIDWVPYNGGSIVLHLGGADSTCDFPTYGTPQYEAAAGAGGNGYFAHISGDLSTMLYGTYLHTDTSGERVAGSSIRASRDGKRVLLPMEADGPWVTTDGSSNPGGLGVNRQFLMIFRRTEADTGWEPEFVHYSELGALYASEFDAAGNAYVAGFDYNANNPIPSVERFTPTVYVPPPILTAPTILDEGTASANGASNVVTVPIPAEATAGDYMVFTSVNRNNGPGNSVLHSISAGGVKVGQVSTNSNHCMGAFTYLVQPGDPGVNSVTITCNIAFNQFVVSWQLVTGAAGIADTSAPAQEVAFGIACRAGAVDTTGTNSLIIFSVSQATSNTYSDPTATYDAVSVATAGTAGLATFSYVEPDVGVSGPFDVVASGSSNSYGWTIAFTGT